MTMLPYLLSTFFQPTFTYQHNQRSKATVTERDDGFTVELSIVGRNSEEVDVFVKDQKLVIKAPALTLNSDDSQHFVINEINHKPLHLNFNLPKNIDEDSIKAHYEKGILNIDIPKKASIQKSIKIQASS